MTGVRADPGTPLIALDAVALDTETTGLDVRRDRVVEIGALRLRGPLILEAESFEVRIDPGAPIPEVATRIHGIADANVAGAPRFSDVAPQLLAFIGDAAVIGHSIGFDLAILAHEAARCGARWREPAALDVGLAAAGLQPGLVDTSLDSLALAAGVPVQGRHSALGDARATAALWAALLPRMQEAEVRTLGEAEALCRGAIGLLARQEAAGWFDRPRGGPGEGPDFVAAAMHARGRRAFDSFLYCRRLADVMSAPPITVAEEATLVEAAALMEARGIGCLIVTRPEGPPGILTERDLLRMTATRGASALSALVRETMTAPVISAPEETFLYRALGRMARRNLRYIAVTGEGGAVSGVFTLRTLLRQRAFATLALGDEVAAAAGAADLARAQAALPGLAAGLLEDGLDARAVAAVISSENRAMAARAAQLVEAELGPAPADYALLVLGSGGRGESLLAPDQDNALVVDGSYTGDLSDEADWFARLGTRLTALLDEAGVPLCKGGVMARNRAWRRTLPEWSEALAGWATKPTPETMLNVDIFYDFAVAHASSPVGEALAAELGRAAGEVAAGSVHMLRAMGEAAGAHGAPLGFLGRIRKDASGRVDLKAGGLLPIVSGARVVALRHGVTSRETPKRLVEAAARAGRSETDAELLAGVHGFLMRLILEQQIADIAAGVKPSSRVVVAALSRKDNDDLRGALGRIERIREVLRYLLSGP